MYCKYVLFFLQKRRKKKCELQICWVRPCSISMKRQLLLKWVNRILYHGDHCSRYGVWKVFLKIYFGVITSDCQSPDEKRQTRQLGMHWSTTGSTLNRTLQMLNLIHAPLGHRGTSDLTNPFFLKKLWRGGQHKYTQMCGKWFKHWMEEKH